MATNIIIKGINTRNHDRGVTPALQIKLRIQVQRRTIIILIINTMNVLDT